MHKIPCGKCGGKGEISAYRNIQGGVCFACAGKGYFLSNTDNATRKANRESKRLEKAAEIAESNKKYEKKVFAFVEAQKENQDFLRRIDGFDPYGRGFELASDIMRYYESKQLWTYNK